MPLYPVLTRSVVIALPFVCYLKVTYLGFDNHLLELSVSGHDGLVDWRLGLALEDQQGSGNTLMAQQIVAILHGRRIMKVQLRSVRRLNPGATMYTLFMSKKSVERMHQINWRCVKNRCLPVGGDIDLQDGSVRHAIIDLVGSNLTNGHLLG